MKIITDIISISIIFIIIFLLYKKDKISKEVAKKFIKYFIFIIFLECSLFNINSYRTLLGDYEVKKYTPEDGINIIGAVYDKNSGYYIPTESKYDIYLEINDINTEISTVKLDITTKKKEKWNNNNLINNGIEEYNLNLEDFYKYRLLYTDETSENYRMTPYKTYIYSDNNSRYMPCFFNGNSKKLCINICYEDRDNKDDSDRVYNQDEQGYYKIDTSFKINNIVINEKIPFEFNIYRVIIIFFIFVIVFCYNNLKELDMKVFSSVKQNNILCFIIILLFGLIIIETLTNKNILNRTCLLQVYNSTFTDSLINGKLYLEEEVPKEILNLKNPYDYTTRLDKKYLFDVALYNGKYYVYFGILPQLIIFIPIKLIFNQYVDIAIVNLIFSIFIIMEIGAILNKIIYKLNSELPYKIFVLLYIIGSFGSMVFFLNRRGFVYECVSIIGLFCIIKAISNLIEGYILKDDSNEIDFTRLCLSSIYFSLSVACRPNLLFVSLIGVPIYIKTFIRCLKEKKDVFRFIIMICMPYILVGSLLMLYNYFRFDSIFEFGAKYQLTGYDMRNLKYRFFTIPIGLITMLIQLPKIKYTFPFISTDTSTIAFYGIYHKIYLCGLVFINPMIIFNLFLKKIDINFDKKVINFIKQLIITGFIICITDIILGGSNQRYSADYSFIWTLSAILIYIIIYKNSSKEIKNVLTKILLIIAIITLILNLFWIVLCGENMWLKNINPELWYKIKYSICFWE